MIYFFHGSDIGKVRAKAFAWVAATKAKAPEAFYVRVQAGAITEDTLSEIAGTQGLFFGKTLALLDTPFEDKVAGELLLAALPQLAESPNAVGILAPKLLAVHAKKIEAKAEKVFKIDDTRLPAGRQGFNSGLVNALGAKDGAALWKEILKAYRAGDVPESVHGLLHWKARDMMQKGNKSWGKDGARKLSVDLIELLSDSRSGDLELKLALERFAFSI